MEFWFVDEDEELQNRTVVVYSMVLWLLHEAVCGRDASPCFIVLLVTYRTIDT